MIDPATPIVVYASRGGAGRFRRYTGIGDVNDQASWTPETDIGQLDTPHVVSGPSGVILVAQDDLSGATMQARHYDGTTFGARVKITDGTHAQDVVQDGGGRVHIVSSKYGGKNGLFYYASSYDGSSWVDEGIDFPSLAQNMRLAVNPDHFGTAVGTLYDNGHVFAARVGPAAAEITPGKFVGASVVSGQVLIKLPGSNKFVALGPNDVVPVGSIIDATKGRVRITIKLSNSKLYTSDFYQGVFRVTQAKSGLGTMVLVGGNFKVCGHGAAVRAAKVKVIRQLWGNGKGKFATKGRYASAAIRGTTWDTIDRCDGTQIKVTKGQVLVTDFKAHKKVVVKAGHSYLARA
jgi:hypothetical protein